MGLQVIDHAPLGSLNTFRVHARARRLLVLRDEARLHDALALLSRDSQRLVLGGGSNILFVGDFEGTVLLMQTRGLQVYERTADTLIELQAGEPWDDAVRWSLAQGLSGLENLAMIPGSCGAAAIQNIGAYGLELAERFESLHAVALDTGEQREFGLADCHFAYRDSLFKRPQGSRWLITRLRLRLGRSLPPRLDYPDLRAHFPAGSTPSAVQVDAAVRTIRSRKLPDPARLGNAGSFFKNPVVTADVAQALAQRFPDMPRYPGGLGATAGSCKIPAGWLIEQCGWRGQREGDAGVHEAHALVLVNHGDASGAQILRLAQRIQASVAERFGISLEPEPTLVGDPEAPLG